MAAQEPDEQTDPFSPSTDELERSRDAAAADAGTSREPGELEGPVVGTAPRADDADPLARFRDPDSRTKLLVGTAALTLLNLLLLLAVLVAVTDGGPGEEVIVDDTPCVVVDADGDNLLYCRR